MECEREESKMTWFLAEKSHHRRNTIYRDEEDCRRGENSKEEIKTSHVESELCVKHPRENWVSIWVSESEVQRTGPGWDTN